MIDWTKLTPREIRDALRQAPIVLTAWREIRLAGTLTYARCRTLDDVESLCDHGEPYAWVRLEREGGHWSWTAEDTHRRASTCPQAKEAADAALREVGYVLDDEPNARSEDEPASTKRVVLRSLDDPDRYLKEVANEGRGPVVWGPLTEAYDYSRDQEGVPEVDAVAFRGELWDIRESGPIRELLGPHGLTRRGVGP